MPKAFRVDFKSCLAVATNQILLVPSDFGRGFIRYHTEPKRLCQFQGKESQGIPLRLCFQAHHRTQIHTFRDSIGPGFLVFTFCRFSGITERQPALQLSASRLTPINPTRSSMDNSPLCDPVKRPLMKIGLPGVKCSGRGEE